jgi:hypothetical protein
MYFDLIYSINYARAQNDFFFPSPEISSVTGVTHVLLELDLPVALVLESRQQTGRDLRHLIVRALRHVGNDS